MLSPLEGLSGERFPFAFTERDTPALRSRIASDLQLVVDEARACDPALRALVLTGGFSRGEGTARDGRPVNDYDLVAIRARPGGRSRYHAIAHDLSTKLGIEVDLLPMWRERLPRVSPKLFWLDVRLGARVIWGDESLLARLPRHDAGTLPPLEGARLLANRAAGLLLAVPGGGEPIDAAQHDLQSAKAALAAMDATLLARGAYAARARDRLALTRDHPDHALFARAVEWKLGGSRQTIAWRDAADALLRAVDATSARAVGDGWTEKGYHAVVGRRLRMEPSRTVRETAWALLAMTEYPGGPDLVAAKQVIGRLGPVEDCGSWPALKRRFFELRARTLQ